jgi:hypothetical protein
MKRGASLGELSVRQIPVRWSTQTGFPTAPEFKDLAAIGDAEQLETCRRINRKGKDSRQH